MGRISGTVHRLLGEGRPVPAVPRAGSFLHLVRDSDHPLFRAAVSGMAVTARGILDRPAIRLSFENAVRKLIGGVREPPSLGSEIREEVEKLANLIRPREGRSLRIAVDGLPGSGKSTLAAALAERYGYKWVCLDHLDMDTPLPPAPLRSVVEHYRLLRTQPADPYDVVIHIDEPVEVARKRVLLRAGRTNRRAIIADLFDYEKLKRIGRVAFDLCEAPVMALSGSRLLVKFRPDGGFRAEERLWSRLVNSGHDPHGLSKEEMLFLLLYGKAKSGVTAYLRTDAFHEEILQGVIAGMEEYFGGKR